MRTADTISGYDIIGDIHGHSDELECLLKKLEYRKEDGVYINSSRKAIFLGDFVDRGPDQKRVLDIVKPMVENGTGYSVMGNHEFNAICFHTSHPDTSEPLRMHNNKNIKQHQKFLDELPHDSSITKEYIEWFKILPLYLDLDGIRIVHAFWNDELINELESRMTEDNTLLNETFVSASDKYHRDYFAIENLLKGPEVDLPEGYSFHDKDGVERTNIRIKWWDLSKTSFRDLAVIDNKSLQNIPDVQCKEDLDKFYYSEDSDPVFIGHYWMQGEPKPLSKNIACLDYSVAKNGKLTAYRWSGESSLTKSNYVQVL